MTVRVKYKVEVLVSSSSAGEEDLGKPLAAITVDTIGEGGTWKVTLLAGAVDTQLFFPNIANAKFVWIRTNTKDPTLALTAVLLRRNLIGAEQFSVEPLPGAKEAQWVQTTSGLSTLFASNPGTADIELTIAIAGD